MDKPFFYVSILLIWIIGLMIFLNLSRYQVQFDRVNRVALVVDKWNGTVQTVPLGKHNSSLQEPKKSLSSKENDMKEERKEATPVIIEGIQNKEP
jgi:hypothetical protein